MTQVDVDLLRDSEMDAELLRIILEQHGFTVRHFETFAEFEQRDSDAYCIITHSIVPDRMFDRVLESLRPLGIPVIYLSGRAEQRHVDECGAFAILNNFDQDALVPMVKRAISLRQEAAAAGFRLRF